MLDALGPRRLVHTRASPCVAQELSPGHPSSTSMATDRGTARTPCGGGARIRSRVAQRRSFGAGAPLAAAHHHSAAEAATPQRTERILARPLPDVCAVGVDAHVGTVQRTDASESVPVEPRHGARNRSTESTLRRSAHPRPHPSRRASRLRSSSPGSRGSRSGEHLQERLCPDLPQRRSQTSSRRTSNQGRRSGSRRRLCHSTICSSSFSTAQGGTTMSRHSAFLRSLTISSRAWRW